ncbi:Uracil-DNA glycosylase, family 4 [hydrothermal vent metagenome]|uniref:Uracil-DNA glycosylase, family 4 n=1 Tax=hydrothermal vent metagenome TaxID=652676 RepID=A0A1W1EJ80_9ZZZZ
MKNLKKALLLKHLYQLQDLNYKFIDINIDNLEEEVESMLPNNINKLNDLISKCHLCQLSKNSKSPILSMGNTQSNIMFIGNKPTLLDSNNNIIFSGKRGDILIKIIKNVLEIEDFYITNIIKCYPPNGREVLSNEVYSCKPYILKEIEIINPKVIITLGEDTYKYLTGENINLEDINGKIIKYSDYYIMPIVDISMVLKNSSYKKELYINMLKLKEFIK